MPDIFWPVETSANTRSCSGTRLAFLYCRLTMWELGCQGLELFSAVAACESSRFPYVTPINSLVLPSSDCWNLSLILNLVLFELKKFLLSTKESLSMSSTNQIIFMNVIGINANCLQVSVPAGSRRGDSVSSYFLSFRGH